MSNIQTSRYNDQRSYVYNKAFARYFDNNDPYNGKTITGGLFPTGVRQQNARAVAHFDLIRAWAEERGLYSGGDTKTQTLKLMEEAGEICRAVLKVDKQATMDGIGDCVVVLTNLAELIDMPIEDCIEVAYAEISNRTGKMVNGTFKKD